MSKKSRRRNKKILAALALAGGAAMLGRGKGEISSNSPSGIDAALVASKAKDIGNAAANTGSGFQSRFKTKVGDSWVGPNEASGYSKRVTGINHPILGQHRVPPGSMRRFKKGGHVTGVAKRGFGRALMKVKK